MFRRFPQTITFLCCLLSMAIGQVPPNPALDPISQVESSGRRAEREFAAGAVPTTGPANTMVPAYLRGKNSEVIVKMAMKNLPASTADLTPYRELLKEKEVRVARLLKEKECIVPDGTVLLNTLCPELLLPDGGAYYSFRRSQYSSRYLSDLGFLAGKFVVRGLFEQAIMVDLGNENIESIGSDHDAASSLLAFKAAGSTDEANLQNLELESGVCIDKRLFKRSLPVHTGTTYLVRFIAYRGAGHKGGVTDEVTDMLNADSRGDLTVVFRVIAIETDGSVSIIWKELMRRPSSILEISQEQKNGH